MEWTETNFMTNNIDEACRWMKHLVKLNVECKLQWVRSTDGQEAYYILTADVREWMAQQLVKEEGFTCAMPVVY